MTGLTILLNLEMRSIPPDLLHLRDPAAPIAAVAGLHMRNIVRSAIEWDSNPTTEISFWASALCVPLEIKQYALGVDAGSLVLCPTDRLLYTNACMYVWHNLFQLPISKMLKQILHDNHLLGDCVAKSNTSLRAVCMSGSY